MKRDIKPQLGDVQPEAARFAAGDKIIVRASRAFSSSEFKILQRQVNAFCGNDVDSLFLDCTQCELVQRCASRDDVLVAGVDHFRYAESKSQVQMSLAKIRIEKGDSFELLLRPSLSATDQHQLRLRVQAWVGDCALFFPPWRFSS